MKHALLLICWVALVSGRPGGYRYTNPGGYQYNNPGGYQYNNPNVGGLLNGGRFVNGGTINGGGITGGIINGGGITGGTINGGGITGGTINGGGITGGIINGGGITGVNLNQGTIATGIINSANGIATSNLNIQKTLNEADISGHSHSEGHLISNVGAHLHSPVSPGLIIQKHVYIHAAPPEPEERVAQKQIPIYPITKHYKIIFIKAPSYETDGQINIPAQPQDQQKTIIYVLVKKPADAQMINIQPPVPTQPSKPEVFFIKYKTRKDGNIILNGEGSPIGIPGGVVPEGIIGGGGVTGVIDDTVSVGDPRGVAGVSGVTVGVPSVGGISSNVGTPLNIASIGSGPGTTIVGPSTGLQTPLEVNTGPTGGTTGSIEAPTQTIIGNTGLGGIQGQIIGEPAEGLTGQFGDASGQVDRLAKLGGNIGSSVNNAINGATIAGGRYFLEQDTSSGQLSSGFSNGQVQIRPNSGFSQYGPPINK